jgi:hypothetical protein
MYCKKKGKMKMCPTPRAPCLRTALRNKAPTLVGTYPVTPWAPSPRGLASISCLAYPCTCASFRSHSPQAAAASPIVPYASRSRNSPVRIHAAPPRRAPSTRTGTQQAYSRFARAQSKEAARPYAHTVVAARLDARARLVAPARRPRLAASLGVAHGAEIGIGIREVEVGGRDEEHGRDARRA